MQPFCGGERPPAGTTEFQLCLPAKYLTPDHTCAACVQGLSRSPATRNPLDLTRRFSIRSRRRQLLESGVSHQLTAAAARRTFVQFTCAPDAPRRYPERRSEAEVEGKWSHLRGAHALEQPTELFRDAGEFLEAVRRMAADCKSIASAAFRSQAESASGSIGLCGGSYCRRLSSDCDRQPQRNKMDQNRNRQRTGKSSAAEI